MEDGGSSTWEFSGGSERNWDGYAWRITMHSPVNAVCRMQDERPRTSGEWAVPSTVSTHTLKTLRGVISDGLNWTMMHTTNILWETWPAKEKVETARQYDCLSLSIYLGTICIFSEANGKTKNWFLSLQERKGLSRINLTLLCNLGGQQSRSRYSISYLCLLPTELTRQA